MKESPFKFLDAYEKEDAAIFFGRDQETDALYAKVFESRLILLYGASGTGKTSLIRCGLANRFDDSDWLAVFVRRGDRLDSALREALLDQLAMHPKFKREKFQGAPLQKLIHKLYLRYFKPIYLIFDQFEEIFILGDTQEELNFIQQLKEVLNGEDDCRIILSMREEYLAHLGNFEKEIDGLFNHRLRVELMQQNALKNVIIGSAKAFDIELEEEEKTTQDILGKLAKGSQQVQLPYLQVFLDKLYRMAVDKNADHLRFDQSLIEQTKGLDDVLGDFLETQLQEIGQAVGNAEAPMQVLKYLVTDDGTKRILGLSTLSELVKQDQFSQQLIDQCLEEFEKRNILRRL